jgi:hypothetical protein
MQHRHCLCHSSGVHMRYKTSGTLLMYKELNVSWRDFSWVLLVIFGHTCQTGFRVGPPSFCAVMGPGAGARGPAWHGPPVHGPPVCWVVPGKWSWGRVSIGYVGPLARYGLTFGEKGGEPYTSLRCGSEPRSASKWGLLGRPASYASGFLRITNMTRFEFEPPCSQVDFSSRNWT